MFYLNFVSMSGEIPAVAGMTGLGLLWAALASSTRSDNHAHYVLWVGGGGGG